MKKINRTTVNRGIGDVTEENVKRVVDREASGRKKAGKLDDSSIPKLRLLARRIRLFFRMLREGITDRYPLPWQTIAAITFALLYFLNPFDIVPDVLFPVGYLDDAAVLTLVFYIIKEDILEYIQAVGLDPQDFAADNATDDEDDVVWIS